MIHALLDRNCAIKPAFSFQKSYILAVILSMLGFTPFMAAQPATLSLGSGAGAPGSNVILDLTLSNGQVQPAGIQWTVQYSAADISSAGATTGPATDAAAKSITCTAIGGSTTCLLYGMNQSAVGNGVIAHISFAVSPVTASTSLPIQPTNIALVDSLGSTLPVSASGGTIVVNQPPQQPIVVTSLTCTPGTLGPGGISTCSVTLSKAAPPSGVLVTLSSNTTSITVPASVTVAAGAATASFTATAGAFTADGTAQLTASLNGSSSITSLTLATLTKVTSLTCNPVTLGPGGTSACSVTLSKAAPAPGVSVGLTSSTPNVTIPASITVVAGATTAGFTATAAVFTADGIAELTASLNGSIAATALSLTALPQVTSLSCSPVTLSPSGTSACSVTLSKSAPAPGALVALSSNTSYVAVPASVTVVAGATNASFTATAAAFTADATAQLTATLNGSTQAFILSLKASNSIQLSSLSCAPATFNAGSSSVCKVTLSGAPTASALVILTSDTPNVQIPASVLIPAGQTSVQFTVTSTLVDTDKTATLNATFGGRTVSAAVTLIGIRPISLSCSPQAVNAGESSKCTVQLNRSTSTRLTLLVSSSSTSLQVPKSISTRSWQSQYSFYAKAVTFAVPGPVAIFVSFLSSTVSANITILAPSAPAITAPSNLDTTVSSPLQVTAQAQDTRGLSVSLTADGLPPGASFTVTPPAALDAPVAARAASDNANVASLSGATTGILVWTPTEAQTGVYSVRLTARSSAGAATHKVIIRVASRVPQIHTVVNAASRSERQVCTGGSLAAVQGSALQGTSSSAALEGGKPQLVVNGDFVDVLDASESELTFVCPSRTPSRALHVQVNTLFGFSNALNLTEQDAAPGIFTLDGSGTGQGLVFLGGTADVAAVTDPDFASQPAMPGDTLYLVTTGVPELAGPATARASIGHFAAEVLSLMEVDGYPGVQLLAVRVPANVPTGDAIPVQVFSQRAESNTVTIAIVQPSE